MEKKIEGKIVSINISLKKGEVKIPQQSAKFIEKFGIEGDAHGGDWHRQVSLLGLESVDKMRGKGIELTNGIFAENITTSGIFLSDLPVGTRLEIGSSIQEVTQIGKHCHNDNCGVKKVVGDCVMPREGIFTRVLKSGEAKIGDSIKILDK
ncbi:MAG: MOSC domain-containing protein [Fusobacteriaceae bacterium]